MQNAGLQYGEGVAPVQESPFINATVQNGSSGSTSSLRQFRKKENVDKNVGTNGSLSASNQDASNSSHVARVAPHNHYPHKQNEYYRFPTQYPDYNSPYKEPTVKYSEIAEPVLQSIPHLDHLPPSVLTKHKEKEYVEMCNIPQQGHLGKPFPEHQFNGQQPYPPDMSMHHQYMHKEPQAPQMHPSYKPETQYIPKDGAFNHQMPPFLKYNIPQSRNYGPLENAASMAPFSHLPRSFVTDHHHLRDFTSEYHPPIDQGRMYAQKQRYYPTPNPTYPPAYHNRNVPTQQYNYPSCNYPRASQINPSMGRYAVERSLSPRRAYAENVEMGMNFPPVSQKIQAGYPNYPAYAQHYQQRRPAAVPQEYYHHHPQQHSRAQYVPSHHPQEMPESHVASNNIRQYLENWAEEEPAGDVPPSVENPKFISRMNREEANEVYVINASELPQYLENGVPLIASENGQYIFKSNVSIDNTGAIKILDKTPENVALPNEPQERVVSLHIIENPKPDCLVAARTSSSTQEPPRQNGDAARSKPNDQMSPYHNSCIVPPSAQNRLNFDESLLPHPAPCDAKKKTSDDENPVETLLKDAHEELDKIVQDTLTSTNMLENCEKIADSKMPDYLNLDLGTEPKDLKSTPEDEANETIMDLSTNSRRSSKSEHGETPDHVTIKQKDEAAKEREEEAASAVKHMPLIFDGFEDHNLKKDETKTSQSEENEDSKIPEDAEAENVSKAVESKEEGPSDPLESPEIEATKKTVEDVEMKEETSEINNQTNNEDSPVTDKEEPREDEEKTKSEGTEEANSSAEGATRKRIFSVDDIINRIGSGSNPNDSEEKKDDDEKNNERGEDAIEKEEVGDVVETSKENEEVEVTEEVGLGETKNDLVDVESSEGSTVRMEEKTEVVASSIEVPDGDVEKPSKKIEEENENHQFIKEGSREKNLEDSSTLSVIEDVKTEKRLLDEEELEEGDRKRMKLNVEEAVRIVEEEKVVPTIEDEITLKPHRFSVIQRTETVKMAVSMKEDEAVSKIEGEGVEEEVEDHKVVNEEETAAVEAESVTPKEMEGESNQKEDEEPKKVEVDDGIRPIEDELTFEESFVEMKQTEDEIALVEGVVEPPLNVEEDKPPSEDLQYRSVLKIEENAVLLEIGGELVEISVNQMNGKKVITVVPLSHNAAVDINDNYASEAGGGEDDDAACSEGKGQSPVASEDDETALRNEEITSTQTETLGGCEEIFEDVILNENEIIIGDDESLEEEINLDLKCDEEQPILCTKASRKLYDEASSPKTHSSLRKFRKVKPSPRETDDKKYLKISASRCRDSKDQKEDPKTPFQELIKQRKMRKERIRLKYSGYASGISPEGDAEKNVKSEVRKVDKEKGGKELRRKETTEGLDGKIKGKERNRRRSTDEREKIHVLPSVIAKEPSLNVDSDKKPSAIRNSPRDAAAPQNFPHARRHGDADASKDQLPVPERHLKFPKTSVPRDPSLGKNANEHCLSRRDHTNLKKKLSIQEYNSRKRKTDEGRTNGQKMARLVDEAREQRRESQRPQGSIYNARQFENVSDCVKDPRRLQFMNVDHPAFPRSNLMDFNSSRLPNISRSLSTGTTTHPAPFTADHLLNIISADPRIRKPPLPDNFFQEVPEPKSIDTTFRRKSLEILNRNYEGETRRVSFDDNVQINEIHTTQTKPVKIRQESNTNYCEVTSSCSDNFDEKTQRDCTDSIIEDCHSKKCNKGTDKKIQLSERLQNDWEDSNSPKDCITDAFADCFLEKTKTETVKTKTKLIIDINDFDTTHIDNELKKSYKNNTNEEGLKSYKEEVDSKLNSLNIQIPKTTKNRVTNEDDLLMHKFLRKEQLTSEEIKQIRRIIYFKKRIQQLQLNQTEGKTGEENYEIKKSPESSTNKDLKLQLKKVEVKAKRKKKRFRNLYSDSPETSENETQETAGEFSVYEGDMSGVKLIFKRKTDYLNLQPVVRLQRCNYIDSMAKKIKIE